MRLFLAGVESHCRYVQIEKAKYVLSSFAYMNNAIKQHIAGFDMFLLDSGAFTFRKKKGNVDWNDYLSKYIAFIAENNIDYFFELDIDNIIGYDNVLLLRNRLESETNKRCIPVWHTTRGVDNYISMCKEYDYVALGSSTKYKHNDNKQLLKYLLEIAYNNNCRVHGLGFTPKEIKEHKFYSVDSTTWDGYRYGTLYKYYNGEVKPIKLPKGKALVRNPKKVTAHNFLEYCKYQKYLDKYCGAWDE